MLWIIFICLLFGNVITALSKEDGNDEDMAEMIAFEIESISNELRELEEKLKVFA